MTISAGPQGGAALEGFLDLLRCPVTGDAITIESGHLVGMRAKRRYDIDPSGIPLFAAEVCSADARAQQAHYEKIGRSYIANLSYPHTREYMAYLDRALLAVVEPAHLGTVAEICCGRGEAFKLLGDRFIRGVGVDVATGMLEAAIRANAHANLAFVQGDATLLPLADGAFDSVFMLGGIHHVRDRRKLFAEIARILKPGGRFYFREPVSDFLVWRAIRAVMYRLSPLLDHASEQPLRFRETVPILEEAGLFCRKWKTYGFLGFCLFMNSDVLVLNRLFRFLPGITSITRLSTRIDEWTIALPGLGEAGLQVVGVVEKPL